MKAPSWTNEEKLILLENVKTFDDIVNKKFSSTLTKEQKENVVYPKNTAFWTFFIYYYSGIFFLLNINGLL